jgi:hypothetical protein
MNPAARRELKSTYNLSVDMYTDEELEEMEKINPAARRELKSTDNLTFDKYTDEELEEMEKIMSKLVKIGNPKRRAEPDWTTSVADFLNERNDKSPWENFYSAYLAAEWKVKSGMNAEFCFFYNLLLDEEGPPPSHVVIKDEYFWTMLWEDDRK